MRAVSPGEVGELFGALLSQHMMLASKYDCLIDLLLFKGVISDDDLAMVAEAASEETQRRLAKIREEIDERTEDVGGAR